MNRYILIINGLLIFFVGNELIHPSFLMLSVITLMAPSILFVCLSALIIINVCIKRTPWYDIQNKFHNHDMKQTLYLMFTACIIYPCVIYLTSGWMQTALMIEFSLAMIVNYMMYHIRKYQMQ